MIRKITLGRNIELVVLLEGAEDSLRDSWNRVIEEASGIGQIPERRQKINDTLAGPARDIMAELEWSLFDPSQAMVRVIPLVPSASYAESPGPLDQAFKGPWMIAARGMAIPTFASLHEAAQWCRSLPGSCLKAGPLSSLKPAFLTPARPGASPNQLQQRQRSLKKAVKAAVIQTFGEDSWQRLRRFHPAFRGKKPLSGPTPSGRLFWDLPPELKAIREFGADKDSFLPIASTVPASKRVLFALHWMQLGGAEAFAFELMARLKAEGYEIYATTDRPSTNDWEARLDGIVTRIFHLPELQLSVDHRHFFHALLSRYDIGLLHIHHSISCYESLPYLRKRLPRLVVLDSLHIIEPPEFDYGYPAHSALRFGPYIDCHHVISDQLRRTLAEEWEEPTEKTVLAYLNVDEARFSPDPSLRTASRADLGFTPEHKVVGFIGRFSRQKSPFVFLVAAAEMLRLDPLGQYRFLMCGSGPLLPDMRAWITSHGLEDKVVIVAERSDPRPIFAACDLLLLTSENEGLALVVYEAMAMELPLLSTDVGGHREVLPPDLLEKREPLSTLSKRMAAKAVRLLGDAHQLETLRKDLRSTILSRHRKESTYGTLLALYGRLVALSEARKSMNFRSFS